MDSIRKMSMPRKGRTGRTLSDKERRIAEEADAFQERMGMQDAPEEEGIREMQPQELAGMVDSSQTPEFEAAAKRKGVKMAMVPFTPVGSTSRIPSTASKLEKLEMPGKMVKAGMASAEQVKDLQRAMHIEASKGTREGDQAAKKLLQEIRALRDSRIVPDGP